MGQSLIEVLISGFSGNAMCRVLVKPTVYRENS